MDRRLFWGENSEFQELLKEGEKYLPGNLYATQT
jgi:hypothetical protein